MKSFARRGAPAVELLEAYFRQPLPPLTSRDERYTMPDTKAWALEQLGLKRYTLDVAACRRAHVAPKFYGLDVGLNGLAEPWPGDSFGNIPFSQWAHWIAKAWFEYLFCPTFRTHSMLLPNDKTEQPGWQDLVEPFREGEHMRARFAPSRHRFSAPGRRGRALKGSPFFGCVLLVWSRDRSRLRGPRLGRVALRPPHLLSFSVLPQAGEVVCPKGSTP